ncbi:GFA family protein [Reinekea forsetii]|nr:GFA family protein [Reinekea forsetii]
MKEYKGSCLCSEVTFTAFGEPLRVGICHCFDCRKHHGALFHSSAIYSESQVNVQGLVQQYNGRHFCPKCGSSVYSVSGSEIELNLGSFDEINLFQPTYELWTVRKEASLPNFQGLAQFKFNRKQ